MIAGRQAIACVVSNIPWVWDTHKNDEIAAMAAGLKNEPPSHARVGITSDTAGGDSQTVDGEKQRLIQTMAEAGLARGDNHSDDCVTAATVSQVPTRGSCCHCPEHEAAS